jgi:hypothetical protein
MTTTNYESSVRIWATHEDAAWDELHELGLRSIAEPTLDGVPAIGNLLPFRFTVQDVFVDV